MGSNLPPFELLAVQDLATRVAANLVVTEYLHWVAGVAAKQYGLAFDAAAMARSDREDATKFCPPHGRFYLARRSAANVGVGALKRLAPDTAEIQRMYVRPEARGLGVGRALAERLIADARAIGYRTIRLESLKALTAAHALYRSIGFVEIPPSADNSMREHQSSDALDRYRASAVFMELRL
jgi:ribosomal protein S18 acetylase RimI-like enzyme